MILSSYRMFSGGDIHFCCLGKGCKWVENNPGLCKISLARPPAKPKPFFKPANVPTPPPIKWQSEGLVAFVPEEQLCLEKDNLTGNTQRVMVIDGGQLGF